MPNVYLFRPISALLVSQLGWWGALIIGFLHRHVSTLIEWPDTPWLFAGLIPAGILLIMVGRHQDDTFNNGPHREGGNDPTFFDSSGGLRGIKRNVYEGGIRVPAIAWWPGRVAPGGETDHIASFTDFMPTFAELAGTYPPESIDGIGFVPTLLGRSDEQTRHEYLYWEFYEGGMTQAVRMGRWKGVRPAEGDMELYDLDTDEAESRDVAGTHSHIVAQIDSLMRAAHRPSTIDWAAR